MEESNIPKGSSDICAIISQWRSVALDQLNSMAGSNPKDWSALIQNGQKMDNLPKIIEASLKSESSKIPLRYLLGINEAIKKIKKPNGNSLPSLLKADEILIDFYFLLKNNFSSTNSDGYKKVYQEATEWLQDLIGSQPHKDLNNSILTTDKLLYDLEMDPIFMAMYAKYFMKQNLDRSSPTGMENRKDLLHYMRQVRGKGELELDGFWNNRKNLEKSLRLALQCSICDQFSEDLRNRLPCLHLVCEKCTSSQSCPLCPSSIRFAQNFGNDLSPSYALSFVTLSFSKLHELCCNPKEIFECSLCIQLADRLCLECASLYCHDHSNLLLYHNETHTLLRAIDLLQESKICRQIFKYCPFHKRPYQQFCSFCQAGVCSHPSCASVHLDHQQSPLVKIDEISADLQNENIRLRSILKTKQGRVNLLMKKIQGNQIDVGDYQEKIRETILTDFNVLSAMIADSKSKFIDDLNKAVDKCLSDGESNRKALEDWILEFDEFDSQTELLPHQDISFSQMSTFYHTALSLTLDATQGAQLNDVPTIAYPEKALIDLTQSIDKLQSNIKISDTLQIEWSPYLITAQDILAFQFCQDSLYVCQPHGFFGQYQLLLYNLTDLSNSTAKNFISDASSFGAMTVDSRTSNVYVASWRKKLLDFSTTTSSTTGNRPHLVIDQFAPLLNKEKSFVLNWIRLQNDVQSVHLEALDRFLYVNDSESIYVLSQYGEITRTMSFNSQLQISQFLLDFDNNTAFAFDFRSKTIAKFDWIDRTLTCEQLILVGKNKTENEEAKIASIAKDDYGHFFVLDDWHQHVFVLSYDFNLLAIVDPPVLTDKETKSSTTLEQFFSRLATTNAVQASNNGSNRMRIEVVDENVYISKGGSIWRWRYC